MRKLKFMSCDYIPKKRPEAIYVNILGSLYIVRFRTIEEDIRLKECDGYCDNTTQEIIIQWFEESPMNHQNMHEYIKKCIRHEIVHAFLYQSGLDVNTYNQWARNEEMVDWIATQLYKISKACENAEEDYKKETIKN